MTAVSMEKDLPDETPLTPPAPESGTDPGLAAYVTAQAQAKAAEVKALGEAKAAELKAAAEADAIRVQAEADAEKQRLANERAAMKLEADRAVHAEKLAKLEAARIAAEAAAVQAKKEADATAQADADRAVEERRSESTWKWAARGIYAVGLIIAAPLQFMAFWDESRPFMVAAPALLEGLALVLAFGAAWAVAHRRDVLPYRIGIGAGALIAAAVNLWHGVKDPTIGLDAGIIGALASLGGPAVLMCYEHGVAQRRDGIPSRRERRQAESEAKALEQEAESKAAAKKAEAEARAAERAVAEAKAADEQKRKDADRQQHHTEVWEVAEAMRSARGAAFVTDQIWGDAWFRVTGSKVVGITAEIEAGSRAAQAHMKAAIAGAYDEAAEALLSQVESQMPPRPQRDPNAPDGRRFNGGVPPLRTPGDTVPYADAAKSVMADAAKASAR
ncbi:MULTISPECIES: hypothetical protein [unclassified Streptomyces]|uniref:hypothetical protein n=1 Tax=unclassified Streptomyces TaxID=2593676 RepID=UPI000DC7A3C7|nr:MULTISPECIES: hypothetical protein [unclassified Streptomyces]AWZ07716.1 hypothetical protein DRB89_27370 [Streptomyces sp. ICC4]AWZ12639.1 hypothetical protein DRB96_10250 [Streptomyces sp. ICC1]